MPLYRRTGRLAAFTRCKYVLRERLLVVYQGVGTFDHLEWTYDGAFEQLLGLGWLSFDLTGALRARQGSPPARGTRLGGIASFRAGLSPAIKPTAKTWLREVNFFIVTIGQCYLPKIIAVSLKRSM